MSCIIKKITLTSFFAFLLMPFSAYCLDVPELKGYVNDYGGMISPSAEAEIERELKAFEQTDSTQIIILTIPSLEGEALEDFSIKVAQTWKIGHKNKDSGIILLASKKERKMRIEVGRGLEGRVTDLMAGRIIDLVIKPRFKRDDFNGGFKAAVSSLIDAARGEFKAEGRAASKKQDELGQFFTFFIFALIFIISLAALLTSRRHRRRMTGRDGRIRDIGFWSAGDFSGSGAGSGGGDSFSGGGGDFSGGGASGDW